MVRFMTLRGSAVYLYKDWFMATEATDLQHPWKDFRVEIREEALCAQKKKKKQNLQKRPSDRHFWEEILMTPASCIFSNLETH